MYSAEAVVELGLVSGVGDLLSLRIIRANNLSIDVLRQLQASWTLKSVRYTSSHGVINALTQRWYSHAHTTW